MRPDLIALKNSLWKPFDVFPSDEEIFLGPLHLGKGVFYVEVPNIFTFRDDVDVCHELVRFSFDLVSIDEVKMMSYFGGYDIFKKAFECIQKKNELISREADSRSVKDNILKIIDAACTEGWIPQNSRWCEYKEFEELQQSLMF